MKIKIYLFFWGVVGASTAMGMNLPSSDTQTRMALINAFEYGNVDGVADIVKNNPSVLSGYENDIMLDNVHRCFAQAFLKSEVGSFRYNAYFKKLVHCGFDLDVRDISGIPLLCAVIIQNDGDKYLDLLKGGAQVNIYDVFGKNPLFYVVRLGDKNKTAKLLSYGAVVNKSLCSQISVGDPMQPIMTELFKKQKCLQCNTHDHDLSSIPCVNRHLGDFICSNCYVGMTQKRCPLCARSLGAFGS